MSKHNGLGALHTLTETVADSVNGFREAAKHAASPDLRDLLERLAAERIQLREELQFELGRRGVPSDRGGSTLGHLHQAWMDLKTTLAGRGDKIVIDEVLRGEAYLKEKFETVMARQQMDTDIESILERAYHRACDGFDLVREFHRREEVAHCEPQRPMSGPVVG